MENTHQVEVAADVLGHLTGPETYLHFTQARGWPDEQYSAWIARQLARLGDALPPR